MIPAFERHAKVNLRQNNPAFKKTIFSVSLLGQQQAVSIWQTLCSTIDLLSILVKQPNHNSV